MSGNKRRNRLLLKFEGLYRRSFITFIADKSRSILLTEYPKSGASWFSLMLSEASGIVFPRNEFPKARVSLFQGHYLKHYGMRKTIVMWRDPKDIMVSWYYHSVIGNEQTNPSFIDETRQAIQAEPPYQLTNNFSRFLEYAFSGKMSPGFTWNDFFDTWWGKSDCIHVNYEQLKRQPKETLSRVLAELSLEACSDLNAVVDKYSIKKSKAVNSQNKLENRFIRKGVIGDWKNEFSDHDQQLFRQLTGTRLKTSGYH